MKSGFSLERVLHNFSSRTPRVVASVTDCHMKSKTLARVTLAFNTMDATRKECEQAVAALFDGLAAPVEGSFRPIRSGGLPAYVGFIRANREVKNLTDEIQASLKVVSSNLLLDKADDSLWEIKQGPSGDRYLCKQGNEDLAELVAASVSTQFGVPNLNRVMASLPSPMEYAAFVNPESEEVQFGYVIASEGGKVQIAKRVNGEVNEVEVDATLLVEVASFKNAEIHKEVAAPSAQGDKAAMKDYYKRLYSYNPEYYAQVEKMIDQHAFL